MADPVSYPLPPSVKVGPWVYRVETWHTHYANSRGRYGECEHQTRTIRVDSSYGPIQTAETLLHELLHAVWSAWRVQDADDEERTVSSLALGLTALWIDNPGLLAWFAAATATPAAADAPGRPRRGSAGRFRGGWGGRGDAA